MNLKVFLDENRVPYETITHQPAFDAQRLAQAVDEPGDHVAKTVLLKSGPDYLVAVLPATRSVDLAAMQQMLRTDIHMATEPEVETHFPDCEAGVVPPFGSRFGMTTFVDEQLSENETIVFEANSHNEAIRMRYADYFELEKPVVTRLTCSAPS